MTTGNYYSYTQENITGSDLVDDRSMAEYLIWSPGRRRNPFFIQTSHALACRSEWQ